MNLKNFSTYAFQPFFGFYDVFSSFFIVPSGAQARDLYQSIENSILRRITLVSLLANVGKKTFFHFSDAQYTQGKAEKLMIIDLA